MSSVIYLNNNLSYKSNLYALLSNNILSQIKISSFFDQADKKKLLIFTDVNNKVLSFCELNSIVKYGLVLDADTLNIKNLNIDFLSKASFIYFIGIKSEALSGWFNFNNCKSYLSLLCHIPQKEDKIYLTEYASISDAYETIIEHQLGINELYVVLEHHNVNLTHWYSLFKDIGINLISSSPNIHEYQYLLSITKEFIGRPSERIAYDLGITCNSSTISAEGLIKDITVTATNTQTNYRKERLVNIICFNPTYLFNDLVKRFVLQGAIHSDFPLKDADAYIWLRPQELWHIEYLLSNRMHKEISNIYRAEFLKRKELIDLDIEDLKARSLVIHHGTCHQPLYQFDYKKLSRSLYNVGKVAGVCEYQECYGPGVEYANKDNFLCLPIGYDHTLFNEYYVKQQIKGKGTTLHIGFVGRAYGTFSKETLKRSKLAEPKGYRKGGDYLIEIALRLKLLNMDFVIHILGENWDELVVILKSYSIKVNYYERESQISYQDFPKIYQKFDVLLITSRAEGGGPVAAVEALSLGIKVIATNVGVMEYWKKYIQDAGGCSLFNFDRKWNSICVESAVNALQDFYNQTITKEKRLLIRDRVLPFTLDAWLNTIYQECLQLIYN